MRISDWSSDVCSSDLRHGFSTPASARATACSPAGSTRQYARIVHHWAEDIGLDSGAYGTHTMRRTKVSLIYRRTRNLRAVQLLLGHTKLESTVRYLGHRSRRRTGNRRARSEERRGGKECVSTGSSRWSPYT